MTFFHAPGAEIKAFRCVAFKKTEIENSEHINNYLVSQLVTQFVSFVILL